MKKIVVFEDQITGYWVVKDWRKCALRIISIRVKFKIRICDYFGRISSVEKVPTKVGNLTLLDVPTSWFFENYGIFLNWSLNIFPASVDSLNRF